MGGVKLEEFAARWRLRMKLDEDGEPIVAGRVGHLYEHGAEGLLGVMLLPGKPFVWVHARKKLEAAGCLIWQDADQEGSALFDPSVKAQARLAIKMAGVPRKRRASLSPAFLAGRQAHQFKPGRGAGMGISGLETEKTAPVGVG